MADEPAQGATSTRKSIPQSPEQNWELLRELLAEQESERTTATLHHSTHEEHGKSLILDEPRTGESHELPRAEPCPDSNASCFEIPRESKIHPLISKAEDAFRRDFDQLMRERSGQWVAYHGDERVGFAATDEDAYALCSSKGIHLSLVLVRSIGAVGDDFFMGPAFTEDLIEEPGK
jgi:hypothetical protein